jgi:signal peptidase I
MNDDRDTRGQELSMSDGRTRPGQVDGQQLGGVPADGAAAGAETVGYPGQSQAPWPGGSDGAFGDGAAGNGPRFVTDDGMAGASGIGSRTVGPGTAGSGIADGGGSADGGPGGAGMAPGPTRPRGDAAGEPQPARRRRKKRRSMSWWVELPILLVFALVLALLIKSFVVQAFFIPSSSMENTLEIGDKVLVNKLVYDFRSIHRGDIVVFNGDGSWDPVPAQPAPLLSRLWDSISGLFGTAPGVHDYIKRVIGVPGDHVACCNGRGQVTVNGVPLSEKSYLYPGDAPSEQKFSIIVPPGRLWVMGDHRSVSWDSRGHMSDPGDGTIPENHVVGRAFVIVAPISRWRILPIPATFQQSQLTAAGLRALRVSGAPVLGALALPGAPAAAGVVAALPLTLLQRRLRRRLRGRSRGGRGPGGRLSRGPGRGPE